MKSRVLCMGVIFAGVGIPFGGGAMAQLAPDFPNLSPLPGAPTFPSPFTPPPTTFTSALASIPADVEGPANQHNFDLFAWREFIALNWPADPATCGARLDASPLTNVGSPRVWETWKTDAEIFVSPPQQPSPWCSQEQPALRFGRQIGNLGPALVNSFQERFDATGIGRALFQLSNVLPQALPATAQAFGGPLVDQSGRFVRYEERVNKDEVDFILDRNLWSKAGQTRWLSHDPIDMPSGDNRAILGRTGAMEVKAAWKIMTPAELRGGRFYTTRALVTTGTDSTGKPITAVADVGMIGFHITHKSKSAPQWTWATFEHVDNLTSSLRRPECRARAACATAFFCPEGCCPDNCQTTCTGSGCAELTPAGQPAHLPTQVNRIQDVARMNPPDRGVDRLNQAFAQLLAGSVWANYQLISTQWPSRPSVAGGAPVPPFLANVALETFNQGPSAEGSDGTTPYPAAGYQPFALVATPSSSCLKCHRIALTAGTDRVGKQALADFSFLLGKAK
jgi:hypothetical protein